MNKGISTSNNNPGGPFAGFFRGLFEVKVAKQQSETVKSESEQKKLIIQIAYGKIELSRDNYFDILSGLGHDQLVNLRKKLVENLKNAHILSPVLPIIENSLMFLDTKNPGASNIVSFSSGLDQRVLNDLSRADTFEGFIRVCQTYLGNKSLDKKNKVKLKSLLMWVGNGLARMIFILK